MPSPVGHALGGAIVGLLCSGRAESPRGVIAALTTPLVLASTVAACLPDLDFLWGRHNMETHSLGAAALAAAAALGWFRGGSRVAMAVGLAWSTHVLFDWLGSDDTAPVGVMAWWPLSSSFFFAHAYVFEAISRRYWLDGFWTHNLWAVTTEVLILGPLLAAAVWWRGRVGWRTRDSTTLATPDR